MVEMSNAFACLMCLTRRFEGSGHISQLHAYLTGIQRLLLVVMCLFFYYFYLENLDVAGRFFRFQFQEF